MQSRIILGIGSTVLLAGAVITAVSAGASEEADESGLDVTHSQNTGTVSLYEVFEIIFTHKNNYPDPFRDVTIEVDFISPTGKQVRTGGFHYGSSESPRIQERTARPLKGDSHRIDYVFAEHNLWKARFAPGEPGAWEYTYVFSNTEGQKAAGRGSFTCVKGRRNNPGFLRRHPTNPFRWVFDDGSPYFPVGLQDCVRDRSKTASVLDSASMEGPFKEYRKNPRPLPSGPMYVRGPSSNPQNMDVYLRHYAQCGFNLYRFSQMNCSYALSRELDEYLAQEAIMTDELLRRLRKYGFRIFYGIFGYQPVFGDEPDNLEKMEKVRCFIKYSVDRWGAYVDFWELLNEQEADDKWYEMTASYLKSIDPYHHPVTTSWERPGLPAIDINAPHWYTQDGEFRCDAVTAAKTREWKKYGKPVIVGEHGNYITKDKWKSRPFGVGGVWDSRSAMRMRIRNWTALFHEIAFIFWNTSYARDGHRMNIWLGPKEREYVRAMQDFACCLGRDLRMSPVTVSEPKKVRGYGLSSPERVGVYLHHFGSHRNPVKGLKVTIDVPGAAKGYWYSTENAGILRIFEAPEGRASFEAPEFTVDLALLITPDAAPDIDRDGLPNHLDPDDDNDGVADGKDAFPLEPEEWTDQDGDLLGDNLDADDDGDGVGDDVNRNGIPDHQEPDFDGDGVPKSGSVPWDAFPLDPGEWRDSDGDGIGDNADPDDDGDGRSDAGERRAGTDPLDGLSF